MSNFEGIVKKNEKSFKPQTRAGDGAGVARVIGGVYAGQDAPVVFEKADQPVEPTTPYGGTDGKGEKELNLDGQVSHPDASGDARYAAAQIAREYRQLVAPVGGIENLSVEQRRQMRDELVRRVGATADGAQQPEGDSASARATRQYVREVASLLFGLIDELSETPDFLIDRREVHKSASHVEIDCPFCHKGNHVERNTVGGLQKISCSSCGGNWQQDLNLSTFAKSDKPDLAALRKQLLTLTENIRTILARRAGHLAESSGNSGSRFVHKSTAEAELHKALANGRPVQFSGQDPRDAAEKASGSGRKFQPR